MDEKYWPAMISTRHCPILILFYIYREKIKVYNGTGTWSGFHSFEVKVAVLK